jgi:hypothetical protein
VGSCTDRRLAVALLLPVAVAASGCVTGHLLDAARRREQVAAYREARLDGDRLLVRYTARVVDDDGRPLAEVARQAAVAIADLRVRASVESLPVERLPDDAPLPGRALPLGPAAGAAPFVSVARTPADPAAALVLHEEGGAVAPPLWSAALGRTRTAPWVYPLLPLAALVDAATTPVLLFFAPAVMVAGD